MPDRMSISPHPRSVAAGLLRLAAVWLALVLVVQGLAAAIALGTGPLHRHDPARAGPALAHADHRHAHDPAHDHDHGHDQAARHHHFVDPGDLQLLPDDPAAADAAALALIAALGLLALGRAALLADAGGHVQRPARAWAWRTRGGAPLLQPPRAG